MADGREMRLMAKVIAMGVQALGNALHEHIVAAETQITELDARKLALQQENADLQRQLAELSPGEALLMNDALITKAV